MSRKVDSLCTFYLPECADSVESHPWLDNLFALATYQVDQHEVDKELGGQDDAEEQEGQTATLSSSPPYTRRGLIRLYQGVLKKDGTIDCQQRFEDQMAAILDTKWTLASPSALKIPSSRGILGVADASGHVSLYQLHQATTNTTWHLSRLATLPFNSHKALCLSLDWSDRIHHYPPARAAHTQLHDASLVVSQSDGSLAWLPSVECAITKDAVKLKNIMHSVTPRTEEGHAESDADSDEDAEHSQPSTDWVDKPLGLETWHAHDHEAWIAALDAFSDGRIIWSGGDDLALKGWDVRTPLRRLQRDPVFTNRKEFQGGVTTMQSHWSREGLWAVGSYDSKLRLFDARSMYRPIATVELPGGIWRLKWHPSDPSLLLAGCMHGGFVVVKVPWLSDLDGVPDDVALEVVSIFEGHDSLAYGCDWERGRERAVKEWACRHQLDHTNGVDPTVVYSCSFYDKKVCSWLA